MCTHHGCGIREECIGLVCWKDLPKTYEKNSIRIQYNIGYHIQLDHDVLVLHCKTIIAVRFKGVFNEHIGCIVPFSFYSIVVESSSILSMPDTNTPTYIYSIDVFAVYMHGSNDFSTMSPHAKCWGHWVRGQHSFIDGSMEAVTHMSPGKSCFIHADACIWPYHVGINHAYGSHCYMGAILF